MKKELSCYSSTRNYDYTKVAITILPSLCTSIYARYIEYVYVIRHIYTLNAHIYAIHVMHVIFALYNLIHIMHMSWIRNICVICHIYVTYTSYKYIIYASHNNNKVSIYIIKCYIMSNMSLSLVEYIASYSSSGSTITRKYHEQIFLFENCISDTC